MRRTATLFALLLLIPCPARAQQRSGIAGTYTSGPATFVLGADGRYAVKAGESVTTQRPAARVDRGRIDHTAQQARRTVLLQQVAQDHLRS